MKTVLSIMVICILSSWQSSLEGQHIAELERLDRIRAMLPVSTNQPEMSCVSASLEMTSQHPRDLEQGPQRSECKLAWGRGWCVLKMISRYDRDPIYRPPGTKGYQPIDFDKDSNLILWRTTEKYVLSSQAKNETLEQQVMHLVSPDGKQLAAKPYFLSWRFKPEDPNNLYHFRQIQMASGWGFGQQLATIQSVEDITDKPGWILLKATSRVVNPPGVWQLAIDTQNGWLVREGEYYDDANSTNSSSISVSSSGTKQVGQIIMAEEGEYISSPFRIRVKIVGIEASALDKAELHPLYKEVKERIDAPLPSNSEIIDSTGAQTERITNDN